MHSGMIHICIMRKCNLSKTKQWGGVSQQPNRPQDLEAESKPDSDPDFDIDSPPSVPVHDSSVVNRVREREPLRCERVRSSSRCCFTVFPVRRRTPAFSLEPPGRGWQIGSAAWGGAWWRCKQNSTAGHSEKSQSDAAALELLFCSACSPRMRQGGAPAPRSDGSRRRPGGRREEGMRRVFSVRVGVGYQS